MSPNVDRNDVAARVRARSDAHVARNPLTYSHTFDLMMYMGQADDLVDEEETIAMALEEIQSVLKSLMSKGRRVDSSLIALSESFAKTARVFPEVDKALSLIEAEEERARRKRMDKGGEGEVTDQRKVLQLGPKLFPSKKNGKASKSAKRPPLLTTDQSGSIPIAPLISSLMESFVSPLVLPQPLVASALGRGLLVIVIPNPYT